MPIVRSVALALSATMWIAAPLCAYAQGEKKKPTVAEEDIMDHRTMAQAHRKAAECLEAGKPEKDCHAQLQKDCKGVGIGKTCGMRHKHKH